MSYLLLTDLGDGKMVPQIKIQYAGGDDELHELVLSSSKGRFDQDTAYGEFAEAIRSVLASHGFTALNAVKLETAEVRTLL